MAIRKALAYSFLGANTVTAIQFGSTLVVARLLTPEQLGVYSVAAVFIMIASILRDFGVANYLVQIDELTEEILRAAFGLIILTATILGSVIVFSAEYLAEFYREPHVADVMYVLAINFFITPLGSITMTLARRDMRFRAISIINVLSACVAVTVSISMILLDFGPVGLAWGAVASTFSTFLMSLRLRSSRVPLIPTLRNSWKIASFGFVSATANIVNQLNVSASDILLGRILTLEAVGYFNRATSLAQFVHRGLGSALNPVLLPWLSQLKRDKQHPEAAYKKITEYTTGLTWPIFASVAALNEEVIRVLFGSQWGQSAELVPPICLAACIVSMSTACPPLYISSGKPSAFLIANLINLPFKVAAIVVFAPYGMMAVALAWPVIAMISALTHLTLVKQIAGIAGHHTMVALKKSMLLGVAAYCGGVGSRMLLPDDTNALWVLTFGTFFALGSAALVGLIVRHPLVQEVVVMAKVAAHKLASKTGLGK